MLQSPDISVTSPLNLTMAFDSTDSSQRVPVSRLTGKRQSFFLHIAHIAAKTSSHFEKKRIHLPECSCVFQSVIRPSFRQICSSTVRKSSLSKRTLGTDSVTGIRAMDIGGGCDSKNSVLLSRRHMRIDKIADEPQILPKTLHFFYPVHFLSAASSRCPQMQEIRCFCKIGCFQATNFFFPLVRTTGRLICGRRAYIVSLGCMRRSCNKDSLHTAHVISIMQDIQINLPAACIYYTRFGCPKLNTRELIVMQF